MIINTGNPKKLGGKAGAIEFSQRKQASNWLRYGKTFI
jgi:hypothetical protein